MMKLVGEKLENYAVSEKDPARKDLFGRSAFNRYYYAAFLIARDMLGDFEPKWKTTPHKDIPGLLRSAVRRPIVSRLRADLRNNRISYGESSSLRTTLNNATNELANLLGQAYDVRRIADYEPEERIVEENKVLKLSTCKLTSANHWPDRASAYCKDIRRVWRETGFV